MLICVRCVSVCALGVACCMVEFVVTVVVVCCAGCMSALGLQCVSSSPVVSFKVGSHGASPPSVWWCVFCQGEWLIHKGTGEVVKVAPGSTCSFDAQGWGVLATKGGHQGSIWHIDNY